MMYFSSTIILFMLLTLSVASPNAGKNIELRSDDSCPERKKQLLGVMFVKSQEYDGRFYYLTNKGVTATVNVGKQTCRVVDGYLAEIDHVRELRFLKKFLRDHSTGINNTFIGGTDKRSEGEFKFEHSGEDVQFLKKKVKDNSKQTNCLALNEASGWDLKVIDCHRQYIGNRFLCEAEIK